MDLKMKMMMKMMKMMMMKMMMMMMMTVVLVGAEMKNMTEVRGDLGTDVTLTCSFRDTDVFWFMLIHNRLKVQIGQTYASYPEYNSPDFETKYLIQENRLIIKTITAEDCRLYFCSRKINGNIVSVDTFHLISDVPVTPTKDSNHHSQSSNTKTRWSEAVVFSSFSLNAVLLFIIVGLICGFLKNCSCRRRNLPDLSPDMLENLQEEIHLLSSPTSSISTCVYSKAQHPLPGHRRTHLDRWMVPEEYGCSGEKMAS